MYKDAGNFEYMYNLLIDETLQFTLMTVYIFYLNTSCPLQVIVHAWVCVCYCILILNVYEGMHVKLV